MKYKFISISKNCFKVISEENYSSKNLPDVHIYLSEKLIQNFPEEESITQLIKSAQLKGVVSPVIGMPDIHTGFGLPIGGVLASDYEKGIISAGAVGYDINCGVRLLSTNIDFADLENEKLKDILKSITRKVPLGMGKESPYKELRRVDMESVANQGIEYFIKKGFGRKSDIEKVENNGCIKPASLSSVSKAAMKRTDQIATLGGGNHFIEVGKISTVFDEPVAAKFGLFKDKIYILIHTGSRGFGHQIATDFSKIMWQNSEKNGTPAPVKGLACAPIFSTDGYNYLESMGAAANYAFSNRQVITHFVRESFVEILKKDEIELGLNIVYDVAHNIAKKEKHKDKILLVHRKGATRALPPNHSDNPKIYFETGHPAIIPGSMGTASYVVTGTDKIAVTYNSVNHGAGRTMSRQKAKQLLSVDDLLKQTKDVILIADNLNKIIDESPAAYKDIDEVVYTLIDANLTKPVIKMTPLAVLKGEE